MANPRLAARSAEFAELRTGITEIEQRATDEARDLTDAETTDLEQLYSRAEAIKPEVDELAKRADSMNATAAVLARISASDHTPIAARTNPRPEAPVMSAGAYVGSMVRAMLANDTTAQETLMRTVAQEGTSSTAGIIPTFITGAVIKFSDDNRRVVNGCTTYPMPAKGKTFTRPRVTQRTTAATQVNEFDELSSQQLLITSDTVTKGTFGGALDLSEQDLDWTDPALMEIALQDLAQVYGNATDTKAATDLVTAAAVSDGATPTTSFDLSTAALFNAGVVDAEASIYAATGELPDRLFLSVDAWAKLSKLVDTTGRPLFNAYGNVQNATGSIGNNTFTGEIAGLPIIVSNHFTNPLTVIVAASKYLEIYEQNKGLATIPQPATMSVRVAYRGYLATNFRHEAVVGYHS